LFNTGGADVASLSVLFCFSFVCLLCLFCLVGWFGCLLFCSNDCKATTRKKTKEEQMFVAAASLPTPAAILVRESLGGHVSQYNHGLD
jgi:hypothetical protein